MKNLNKKIRKSSGINYRYLNEKQTVKLINKMVKNGLAHRTVKGKYTVKKLRKKLEDFKLKTGTTARGTTLLRKFISTQVRLRTDASARSAYDNFIKHCKSTFKAYTAAKGDTTQLSAFASKFINVMFDCRMIDVRFENDKAQYKLVNLPMLNDVYTVSDRYLEILRACIKYFGDEEYGEAFGS